MNRLVFGALAPLLFAAYGSDSRAQSVEAITASSLDDLKESKLREYLTQNKLDPVNLKQSPILPSVLEEVRAITEAYAKINHLNGVQVILINDFEPNAYYMHWPNGERVVAVTMGMLTFVENKDELALVLGHEINHGVSQLQNHADNNTGPLLQRFLHRPVENEVDMRATYQATELDFNPHALIHVLRRLQARSPSSGDGAGPSHTTFQNRLDTLGSELTYMARKGGQTLRPDIPEAYRTGAVTRFQDEYVASGALRSFQQKKFTEALAELKTSGKMTERALEFKHPYPYIADAWRHLSRHVVPLFWGEELLQLKAQAFAGFHELFHRVHEAHENTIDRSAAYRALFKMVRYSPDVYKYRDPYRDRETSLAAQMMNYFGVGTFEELPASVKALREDDARQWALADAALRAEARRAVTAVDADGLKFFKTLFAMKEGKTGFPPEFGDALRDYSAEEMREIFHRVNQALDQHLGEIAYTYGPDRRAQRAAHLPDQFAIDPAAAAEALRATVLDFWAHDRRFKSEPRLAALVKSLRFFEASPELARRAFTDPVFATEFFARAERDFLADISEVDPSKPFKYSPYENHTMDFERLYALAFHFKMLKTPAAANFLRNLRAGLTEHFAARGFARPLAYAATLTAFPKLSDWATTNGQPMPPFAEITKQLGKMTAKELAMLGRLGFDQLVNLGRKLPREEMFRLIYELQTQNPERPVEFLGWLSPLAMLDQPARTERAEHKNRPIIDHRITNKKRIEAYSSWIRSHHPLDLKARVEVAGVLNGKWDFYRDAVHDVIEASIAGHRPEAPGPRTHRVFRELIERAKLEKHESATAPYLGFDRYIAAHPDPSITDSLFGLLNADRPVYSRDFPEKPEGSALSQVASHLQAGAYLDLPLETLADWTAFLMHKGGEYSDFDDLFDRVWALSSERPDLRAKFLDPALLAHLTYEDNKFELSAAILEAKFNLSQSRKKLARGAPGLPANFELRPEVHALHEWLQTNLPQFSGLRDRLVEYAESRLITSARETERLGELRHSRDTWYKNPAIALADAPHLLGTKIKDNVQRWKSLQYLIGASDELEFDASALKGDALESRVPVLRHYRRQFQERPAPVRNFLIQSLLGNDQEGLLGRPEYYGLITNLILGKSHDNPILRALFESYLEAVPAVQRRVILSQLLQAMSSRPPGSGLDITAVFNAMDAFGAKAAQALRTTGLGGTEIQKQLDHFFDEAQPPDRGEIVRRFKETFGPELSGVLHIGELLGSGSLNYVVLAKLELNGQAKTVALRFQREGVRGQVKNENEIWEKAIYKLRRHPQAEVNESAEVLEEVRANVMTTLHENGAEFSLGQERAAVARAQGSYDRQFADGWQSQALRPLPELPARLPSHLQDRASVYEFIDGNPVNGVEDRELRARLAGHIVDTELRALFEKRYFDRDSHPGNWLVDEPNRTLIRLDYAQIGQISEPEAQALRRGLAAMIHPKPGAAQARILAEHFSSLFVGSREIPRLENAIAAILSDSELPSFRHPHLRFFFLRDRLAKMSGAKLKINESVMSGLSLIARVSLFAEHLDPDLFGRKLMEFFTEPDRVTLTLAHGIRIVREKCLEQWARLRP